MVTRSTIGESGETQALEHLQRHGLQLVSRNYRVAAGPGARAGEVDLIMLDDDGTLVFVEVRSRSDARHGGAAASVGPAKRRRHCHRGWRVDVDAGGLRRSHLVQATIR